MNLKTIRLYAQDFLLFLKNPGQQALAGEPPLSRSARFWLALLTKLCIAIAISVPLVYLVDRFVLRLRFSESMEAVDSLFLFIIFGVIIAPVLEELVFRYPLKFVKPKYLKFAVYLSSIAFGLVHSINYENSQPLFYALLPIIISSQALGGFVLAYLRLREGLLWSMFSHGLFNAMVGLSLLFVQGRVALDEKEGHYTLLVKEYAFKADTQATRIYRDGERIDSIIWKQASLQSLVDSLHGEGLYADQTIVDVELKTTRPIPADSVLTLLKKEFRIE